MITKNEQGQLSGLERSVYVRVGRSGQRYLIVTIAMPSFTRYRKTAEEVFTTFKLGGDV